MDYRVKTIIGGIELLETSETITNVVDGVTYETPSISAITLIDNASIGTMDIGATPSDCLTFTINDPNKQNYDGETVELWLAPPDDDTAEMEDMSAIEDEVGSDTNDEGIDAADDSDELDDEDDSEGEEPTPEDIADVEAETIATIEGRFTAFEGEDVAAEDEDTDEGEEPEWIRVGVFFVQGQRNSDDGKSVTLICYDSMQKLNSTYIPAARTASIQNMFDDLRAKAFSNFEVAIDEFDFDTDGSRNITMPSPVSYREALGYFAGLIGGYAACGDDGSIGFSIYSFTDGLYLDSALNYINIDASGEMELEGISCNRGDLSDDILTTGTDGDIIFHNPFMTQDILDDILEEYRGLRFCGGSLNMLWDDSIKAGLFIRIMSPEEYANYIGLQNAMEEDGLTEEEILDLKENMNALGRVLLVSSQVIDFTGDATTTIISRCNSGTQAENQLTGPTDAKFRRIQAEVVDTKLLIAEKADIEDLQATNALFTKVLAEDMTVTNLTGAKADFGTLLADDFTAEQITALQAHFDTATAGSVTAEDIAGKTGTFKTLLVGSFTADQISAAAAAFQKATIGALTLSRLDAGYANIDFANVTTESVKNLFVNVGMLENAVISEGQITGTLAGVHVVADVIEANTIVAGDFVVQGADENWYRINPTESGITQEQLESLNAYDKYVSGEYIVAKSITANQIAVTDLYAFGATIAGLQLESGKIHSIGKTSVSSSVPGIYMDSTGQFNTGDATNFIASWYDSAEQKWKVAIRADEISFGGGQSVEEVINNVAVVAENTLIYDHTYEYVRDSSNIPVSANFTAFLYRGGVDVKTEQDESGDPKYPPESFTWYLKREDKTTGAIREEQIGTGYTCSVNLNQCGYGAEVIGKFSLQDNAEALATNGNNLTTAEDEPLTVRATGDSVRVRDLTVSTTIFPSDKLMLVGAEDEHLVTIQTLQDYLNANLTKQVLFNTTAYWDAQITLVSDPNTLYIYTDHDRDLQGNAIAGIKAGDGNAYVVDLPFTDAIATEHIADSTIHTSAAEKAVINSHIANSTVHITQAERDAWNQKVRCYYAGTEQLVFTTA